MSDKELLPYQEPLGNFSALWGDQYALTMAQALFANGRHDRRAVFHAFIRKNPFHGGYLVTAGQGIVTEWLSRHWRFDAADVALLRRKTVLDPASGAPVRLFTDGFIDMVTSTPLRLDIDAMPEGELAFPDEPILRVSGPLWQCLMVESGILNAINSQSLFATLASRLIEVAGGAPVVDFGLRRAQTLGGLEPSRGAWIGGTAGTSNMLAEKYYGIPSSGTFAHAYVMAYEDELAAFTDYARAMPCNGVFLVDTYNTLHGVEKAIQACRETGVALKGIRLDSGDLTYLSRKARQALDRGGFKSATIIASNDLDEDTIAAIRQEGGKIDGWGVGTNLATSRAQPALGAVYKIGAIAEAGEIMRPVIKLSEQAIKTTIPGALDVLRYIHVRDGRPVRYDGDTIIAAGHDSIADGQLARQVTSVPKDDETQRKRFRRGTQVYCPLQPLFRNGEMVGQVETIHDARQRAKAGLAMLDPTHRRLKNPHVYRVGIEEELYRVRQAMILELRERPDS